MLAMAFAANWMMTAGRSVEYLWMKMVGCFFGIDEVNEHNDSTICKGNNRGELTNHGH